MDEIDLILWELKQDERLVGGKWSINRRHNQSIHHGYTENTAQYRWDVDGNYYEFTVHCLQVGTGAGFAKRIADYFVAQKEGYAW